MNWDKSKPRMPKNVKIQPIGEVSVALPPWELDRTQAQQVEECRWFMRNAHMTPQHLLDAGYGAGAIQTALEDE